jgi:hypothetical protein
MTRRYEEVTQMHQGGKIANMAGKESEKKEFPFSLVTCLLSSKSPL